MVYHNVIAANVPTLHEPYDILYHRWCIFCTEIILCAKRSEGLADVSVPTQWYWQPQLFLGVNYINKMLGL